MNQAEASLIYLTTCNYYLDKGGFILWLASEIFTFFPCGTVKY